MATRLDIDYWAKQGVQWDQIFDPEHDNQIRPGWKRIKNGYAPVGWPDTSGDDPLPEPTHPPPSTGGGGDDPWGYLTEPFPGKPPAWINGPTLSLPTLTAPPPFSYPEFVPPTADSIYADPSYQFRKREGEQSLQQSAAGRGVLRTGGTLKDLVNYGQNAASQEYSNIFNRGAQTHDMGLEQALATYGTNWGVSKDVLGSEFNARKAEFEPLQRNNELMNEREFNNFLSSFDIFEKNRRRAGDYLTWAASQGNT